MMALIGSKDKKYGLILPAKKKKTESAAPATTSVFAEESDEDDKEFDAKFKNFDSRKETMRAQMKKQTQISLESVLADDPSAFEYDSVYDSIHANREKKTEEKRGAVDRKPRYMEKLLKTAHERKLDRELQNDLQVQKELEAEGDQFKDKEKFVTASYKKKMAELRAMEARRKDEEMVEEAFDITKQDGLGGFYRFMLQNKDSKPQATQEAEEDKKPKEEATPNPDKSEEASGKSKRISPSPRRRSRSPKRRSSSPKPRSRSPDWEAQRVAEEARREREERRRKRELQQAAVKELFARRTDESKAEEARRRYLERKQRARAPVVESDSD